MNRTLVALLVVALSFSVAYVRADVAPPDDYEELCTLERTCPNGKECVLCPANRRYLDACSTNLGEQGFAMKCKSWGASVWKEVWCRDAVEDDDASLATFTVDGSADPLKIKRCKASTKPSGEPEADSDCSCRAPGAQGRSDDAPYVLGFAAAAIALLFVRTRRPG